MGVMETLASGKGELIFEGASLRLSVLGIDIIDRSGGSEVKV
jgi:hypothetical protein